MNRTAMMHTTGRDRRTEPGRVVESTPASPPARGFPVIGGLLILFGFLVVIGSLSQSLITLQVVGFLLLGSGVAQALAAARAPRDRATGSLLALLHGAAGVLLLADPVSGAIGLTLLFGLLLVGGGLVRLARHAFGQSPSTLQAFGAVVSLLLGAAILVGWPEASVQIFGAIVGIEFALTGWAILPRRAGVDEMPSRPVGEH